MITNAKNDCSVQWKGANDASAPKNATYSSFMINKDYLEAFVANYEVENFATFNCSRNGTIVGYWGKREGSADLNAEF